MLAEICRTSRSGCEKTRVRTRVGCTVYLVVVSGRSEEYEGLTMIKRNSFDADVMSAGPGVRSLFYQQLPNVLPKV